MNIRARKEQKASWNAMHQETANQFRTRSAVVSAVLFPIALIIDRKKK